jgi:cystathionine beta-lyase
MVLRGIRSLAARMEMHQRHADRLARWLRARPEVVAVHYPGLEDHPGHGVHISQSTGPGAVLSFDLGDARKASGFLRSVKLALPAVSLGGVETILSWPCRMSHASMPPEERRRRGIGDGLLRLSVGLEDPADLERDFERALEESDKPV